VGLGHRSRRQRRLPEFRGPAPGRLDVARVGLSPATVPLAAYSIRRLAVEGSSPVIGGGGLVSCPDRFGLAESGRPRVAGRAGHDTVRATPRAMPKSLLSAP